MGWYPQNPIIFTLETMNPIPPITGWSGAWLRLGTTSLPASHGKYIIGSIWVVLCAEPLCDSANVLLHCPSYGQQRADLRAAMAGQGLVSSFDYLFNLSRTARGRSF